MRETTLRAQFTAMETAVARLQSTSSALGGATAASTKMHRLSIRTAQAHRPAADNPIAESLNGEPYEPVRRQASLHRVVCA